MRSITETGKDGPLVHTAINSGAGSGVVLRHRATAAACACLTVDAAVAAAPEDATQIRPADGFLNK